MIDRKLRCHARRLVGRWRCLGLMRFTWGGRLANGTKYDRETGRQRDSETESAGHECFVFGK